MNYRWVVFVTLATIHSSSAEDASACTKMSACSCSKPDGSTLDLSPLIVGQIPFYESTHYFPKNDDSDYAYITYYFHPCGDATLDVKDNITKNNCNSASVCERFVSIKKANVTIKDDGYQPAAIANSVEFVKGSGSSIALYYKFTSKNILINLVCSPGDSNDLVIKKADSNSPVLTFYSKHACFSPPTDHHSFGTTLLIILFVLILAYMALGCCVKRFLMGARGIEVIPNLNFWKELPSLVKDGVVFIQNGFKPPAQSSSSPGQNPNPNTYDSI